VRFGRANYALCEIVYSEEDGKPMAVGPTIVKAESPQQIVRDLKEMMDDSTSLEVLDQTDVKDVKKSSPFVSDGQFHFPFYPPLPPDVVPEIGRTSSIPDRMYHECEACKGSETVPGSTQGVLADAGNLVR